MDPKSQQREQLRVNTASSHSSVASRSQSNDATADPVSPESNQRNADNATQSKRNSDFYSGIFAYREPQGTVQETIRNESVVTVILRTNVIVQDEYTFITSFAEFVAQRYQREQSSVLVVLQHSSCILFGGTFDPAYQASIAGLPGLVQSTVNKRNAVLLQGYLTSHLGVPAKRGIIHFQLISEENLATNGATVLAEIEAADPNGSLLRTKRHSLVHSAANNRNRQSKRWTIFKEVWSPVSPVAASTKQPVTDSEDKASHDSKVNPTSEPALAETVKPLQESPPPPKSGKSSWRAKRKSFMQRLGR